MGRTFECAGESAENAHGWLPKLVVCVAWMIAQLPIRRARPRPRWTELTPTHAGPGPTRADPLRLVLKPHQPEPNSCERAPGRANGRQPSAGSRRPGSRRLSPNSAASWRLVPCRNARRPWKARRTRWEERQLLLTHRRCPRIDRVPFGWRNTNVNIERTEGSHSGGRWI
jgi:hypothetical protein